MATEGGRKGVMCVCVCECFDSVRVDLDEQTVDQQQMILDVGKVVLVCFAIPKGICHSIIEPTSERDDESRLGSTCRRRDGIELSSGSRSKS